MPREFKLPDLGEGIAEAQVIRVMIKEGEQIARDQYLMEVETDKAAVEIELGARLGEKVRVVAPVAGYQHAMAIAVPGES